MNALIIHNWCLQTFHFTFFYLKVSECKMEYET
jgi:hypothetical protein